MAHFIEIAAIVLTAAGSLLGLVAKVVDNIFVRRAATRAVPEAVSIGEPGGPGPSGPLPPPPPPKPPGIPPGKRVLLGFSAIVIIFGVVVLAKYWKNLDEDLAFFAVGLFLTMVAGMFVQVLVANYKAGRELFDVTASQLIYPLLFSIIVFYAVWAVGAGSQRSFFAFYAAFLNGYFWETVVATARPPEHSGG